MCCFYVILCTAAVFSKGLTGGLGQQTAVHTQVVISSTSLPVCFGKVHLQFVSWVSPVRPVASWYPYALEKKN